MKPVSRRIARLNDRLVKARDLYSDACAAHDAALACHTEVAARFADLQDWPAGARDDFYLRRRSAAQVALDAAARALDATTRAVKDAERAKADAWRDLYG